MSKSILYSQWSNSAQKTAPKNSKYSRNETTMKIDHLAKAIAFAWAIDFAKHLIWAKKLKCLKHLKIDSVFTLELFCAKKHLEKTPNTPETRGC